MIDLTLARTVLAEAAKVIDRLDGVDHDDTQALVSQSKGKARQERAERSQELQRLGFLGEALTMIARNEYLSSFVERRMP